MTETASKGSQPFFNKAGAGFFHSGRSDGGFFQQSPARGSVQTKLKIGQANDSYEKEADAVADRVVQRTSEPVPAKNEPMLAKSKQVLTGSEPVQAKNQPLQAGNDRVQRAAAPGGNVIQEK